jgi:hypothetical protein
MPVIDTFAPQNHTLLGEGVWGSVYDLGDGTVLKLAKETGGIGSGTQKVSHEIKIMRALHKDGSAAIVPAVLDFGNIEPESELYRQGYTVWLRSTKMPGTPLNVQTVQSMSKTEQDLIAASLAHALTRFHDLLRHIGINKDLQEDQIWFSSDLTNGLSAKDQHRLTVVQQVVTRKAGELQPIHGDFNISNILFDKKFEVSGILDFAETCLGHNEDDICSLTGELPFIKDMIIAEYELITGKHINADRLKMAEMKRDLISLLICRYRINKPTDARLAEQRLDGSLKSMTGLHI